MGNQCCNDQKLSAQETTMAALEPKIAVATLDRDKEDFEQKEETVAKRLPKEDQVANDQKRRRGSLSKPVPQMMDGLKLPPPKKLRLNEAPTCQKGFSIDDQKLNERVSSIGSKTGLKVPSNKELKENVKIASKTPQLLTQTDKKVSFQVPVNSVQANEPFQEDSDSSDSSYEQVLGNDQEQTGNGQLRQTSSGLENRRPTGYKPGSIKSQSRLI